ncbi:hypothetical protein WM008_23545 [Vibrio vulnificus]|uniref:hypothetical protein n=1 Tax=Vibrio vulnificus TaxID=672 RepID=UPI0002DF2BD1|nr:hypothetical protein [Vibrio vulnificus]EII3054522.1 hypothetical protein [Vibrio vulnificus]EJL7832901.1 hypothetical protein [Vibrio vulnificus]MCU8118938.1 hypothetical protein [Vibrio vulnificus]RZP68798.1 hypothetical protein D8T53_09055 [Vibrio vulnificus]RZR05402.1 hypothetical protein D8T43_19260 [Vibrio vulnificus]
MIYKKLILLLCCPVITQAAVLDGNSFKNFSIDGFGVGQKVTIKKNSNKDRGGYFENLAQNYTYSLSGNSLQITNVLEPAMYLCKSDMNKYRRKYDISTNVENDVKDLIKDSFKKFSEVTIFTQLNSKKSNKNPDGEFGQKGFGQYTSAPKMAINVDSQTVSALQFSMVLPTSFESAIEGIKKKYGQPTAVWQNPLAGVASILDNSIPPISLVYTNTDEEYDNLEKIGIDEISKDWSFTGVSFMNKPFAGALDVDEDAEKYLSLHRTKGFMIVQVADGHNRVSTRWTVVEDLSKMTSSMSKNMGKCRGQLREYIENKYKRKNLEW